MPASRLERTAIEHRRFVLAAVAALWAASRAGPALRVGGGHVQHGVYLILHGGQGNARGIQAWCANPLFAAGFVCAALRFYGSAAVLSGLALLLAFESTAVAPILRLEMSRVPKISLLPGFYTWLAAIIALCLWSAVCAVSKSRPNSGC
jgi:hypothetical protein